MSLRDEMASKAQDAYRRGFTPGEMVDDLMPLVERAVTEAAQIARDFHAESVDAIVARVTGREL